MVCRLILSLDLLTKDLMMEESWVQEARASVHSCPQNTCPVPGTGETFGCEPDRSKSLLVGLTF